MFGKAIRVTEFERDKRAPSTVRFFVSVHVTSVPAGLTAIAGSKLDPTGERATGGVTSSPSAVIRAAAMVIIEPKRVGLPMTYTTTYELPSHATSTSYE